MKIKEDRRKEKEPKRIELLKRFLKTFSLLKLEFHFASLLCKRIS